MLDTGTRWEGGSWRWAVGRSVPLLHHMAGPRRIGARGGMERTGKSRQQRVFGGFDSTAERLRTPGSRGLGASSARRPRGRQSKELAQAGPGQDTPSARDMGSCHGGVVPTQLATTHAPCIAYTKRGTARAIRWQSLCPLLVMGALGWQACMRDHFHDPRPHGACVAPRLRPGGGAAQRPRRLGPGQEG